MGAFLSCFETHNSLWRIIMQQNRNALADSFLSSPRAYHRHCQNVRWGPRALQGAPIEKTEPGLLPRPGRVKPPLQPGGPQRNPHYFGSWSSQLCCGSEKRGSLPEHHCFHTRLRQPDLTAHAQLQPAELRHDKNTFRFVPCEMSLSYFCWGYVTALSLTWVETPFSARVCLFKSTSSYNLECLCCLYIQIKLPF